MLYLLDVHEIHAVQCAALELSWGREISKLTFNSFSFYGMEIHLDGHDVCTYNEGTWIKLLFRSSRVEMSVTIMAWRVKWKAKLSFKNLEIWDVLVFGHIGCIQWCKRKFVRIIPGSDFLPAIWRIETNFVKSQEDKWGGWKAKRWIYDKKAPDMLPWIQPDLIKNTKHFRYETVADVPESWVWWRADFQSGSRVLKRRSDPFLSISMAYNVISCWKVAENTQILKKR